MGESLEHLADAFNGQLDLLKRSRVGHADKTSATGAERRTGNDRNAEFLQKLQRFRFLHRSLRYIMKSFSQFFSFFYIYNINNTGSIDSNKKDYKSKRNFEAW